ncbi:hypothetical protein DFH08DRAFT_968057 [Mycena albidolilacea]|uniref:Uncharacterized protein n=1 Tax=Mycena albidolilacea TaxID=1033008 RepID=A0AAD7EI28_9AGAR|nr:hypothetical protein DFH08DRAFT_968057 [Mycena albidolilacea]
MTDWAATADVLKAIDRFRNEIGNNYDLRAPQLLHRLNSTGAWKTDPSAAITEGAKKVTDTVDTLTRRIETNEHESRARDTEMKQHLVGIDNNVTAVTNLAVGIGRHQEELAGGFLLLQKQTHLEATIARIDTDMSMARQTFKHPLDEAEREEAHADITRLKIDRSITQENLERLLGNTPRIAPTDPYIPAPAPPAASTSNTPLTPLTPPGIAALGPRSQPDDTESNPSKRMRRTASHDNTSNTASQLEPGTADEDTVMSVVCSLTHPPRSQLMAARSDTQAGVMITKPKPSLMHCYTKGPDGTRGFRSRKRMSAPCSVGMSRRSCLSDRLPLNVQIPSNALLFLAVLVLLTSFVKVAAAATLFSMYALNANGLVNSAKLHHINSAITARNPHAFTLTESKTNTKTGPNLPNGDYNIFEEPGVQADNHHLYKWGVALGICKNIQIAQHVQVTAAAIRGRVVTVDIVLQANNSSSFTHRVIGAYAPWDPSTPAMRDFWPELTKLCQSTPTSWTLGGNLNATVSSSERSSGGTEARAQYLKFLDFIDGQDLWYNNPERSLHHDWTSRASPDTTTGNIIDQIVSSKRSYVHGEICVADRSQDFVPYTNHRAVTASIVYTNPSGTGRSTFPSFRPTLTKPRIKFPTGAEKYRHNVFHSLMDDQLDSAALHHAEVVDDESFLHVGVGVCAGLAAAG